MTGSPHRSVDPGEARFESFWLPPNTSCNGLAAERWAELIALDQNAADRLLAVLAAAGIAARAERGRTSRPDGETRVWVDPDRYGQAENVLLRFQNAG